MVRRPMTNYRVRRIIDAELKRFTNTTNSDAPATTGSVFPLTDIIGQGISSTQRIGDWIKVINLHGNLSVKAQDSVGQIVAVRAFIFQWNETAEAGPPSLEDIVNNVTAPTGQFSFSNKGQFRILWTKLFNVVNQDNNPAYQRMLKIYIRTNRLPKTLFTGVLPRKFHYYFMIFSDTAAPGEIPEYRLDLTVRYTDS